MTIRTLSTILFVTLIAAFAISKQPTLMGWVNAANADLMKNKKLHAEKLELLRHGTAAKENQVTSNGDAHATAEIE